MALPIRTIPDLTGAVAERFLRLAEEAEKNPVKIDFSKQMEIMREVMKKAKL